MAVALGKVGLALAIVGFAAATFGAACEAGLSVGYSIAQYFGAQWGKYVRPGKATPFRAVLLIATLLGVTVLLTGVDPVMVTEASVVFSAVALPLTYFPILVVANDRDYLGELDMRVCGLDAGGATLQVLDARLAPGNGLGRELVSVAGLIVGRGGRPGSLLGDDRADRAGPRPVAWVVRRLHRAVRYVSWDEVERLDWDAGEVHCAAR